MQNKTPLRGVPQYGGRPIAYSTKPVDISPEQAKFIEGTLTVLLRDVETFTSDALKDSKLLRTLGLPGDLDPRPTPLGLHIPFARFDFLFDGENLNVLELNTDGTAGWNISEWVNEAAELNVEENPNSALSARLLQGLLEHKPNATQVALIDFAGIGTSWEQFDLIKRWNQNLLGLGLKSPACQFCEPGTKTWNDNALVYRRALTWQLRAQPEKAKPFLEDWRENKITVVGGWSSDVGMSKAWPVFLKPKWAPETLLLDDSAFKKLSEEKDNWIIKGALSYSGHAIFRGLDLKESRWVAALEQATKETKSGRPWVAQRRVEIPNVDGAPYELGLYFINGRPSGYMCRWGHDEAISETSTEVIRPVRIAIVPKKSRRV